MKVMIFLFSFWILVIGGSACTVSDDSNREGVDTEAIEALLSDYASGYDSRDVDHFMNVFTEDAVRMPPNGSAVFGREEIRAYYEKWFAEETLNVDLAAREIRVAGDCAVGWGTYEATVTSLQDGTSRVDRGKWMNVFRRGSDGKWRFHRNIWNSSQPLPPCGEE